MTIFGDREGEQQHLADILGALASLRLIRRGIVRTPRAGVKVSCARCPATAPG